MVHTGADGKWRPERPPCVLGAIRGGWQCRAVLLAVFRRDERKKQGRLFLDNLTLALCISIGTGVPWLIAVYSDNGARQLIGNTVFGMVGTAVGATAFNWSFSEYGIVALVSLGPAVAFLTITAGQAAKRAILSKLSRSPY
jgi:hypothetical protein